jgi:shikimate kinase/3-dehydroquinate synthase
MTEAVALVGLRGAGKTAVGRRLAARLGWEFADSDDEVERRLGVPIAALFSGGEETRFRDEEASVLAELLARRRIVVATGGGCVEREETRAALASAFTVWLTAPVPVLASRCAGSDRPPLTGLPPEVELAHLSSLRAPLYAGCSSMTVITANRTVEQVCDAIEKVL